MHLDSPACAIKLNEPQSEITFSSYQGEKLAICSIASKHQTSFKLELMQVLAKARYRNNNVQPSTHTKVHFSAMKKRVCMFSHICFWSYYKLCVYEITEKLSEKERMWFFFFVVFSSPDRNNFVVMSNNQNNMFVLVKYTKCSPLPWHVHTNTRLHSLLPAALIKAAFIPSPGYDSVGVSCLQTWVLDELHMAIVYRQGPVKSSL